ncbi:hypothetical protein ACRQ5Q_27065 [Bradyrhizobium sp. PMVTL-01]|uniref:hypothetical protein n=1 Tax=Bradyrhizobium sp. PMVTL-01 TaxID=3434999 RepID=UPI003F70189C
MRRRDLLTGLLVTTTAGALPAAGLSMPSINNETNALASTISPTPEASWLSAVDTLISTLKMAGIWSTFDLFYCFAAPSANACAFNWVDTSEGRLTAHGKLSYHSNAYAASDGSTGYFSTTFNVNSGSATDGNAEFGYFCLSEDTSDSISPFQCSSSKHSLGLQASLSAINDLTASLNTSTSASFSSQWGSTVGHWVLQQNDISAQLEAFLDGSSLGTSTQTHSAGSGTVQIFKTADGSFTTRQTAFVHYGSKLTSAQQLALSKALYKFLTALDVRPKAGYLGLTTGPTNIAPYKHVSTGPTGNDLVVPETSSSGLSGLVQCRAGAYPYCLIKVNDPNYLNLWRLEIHSGDVTTFDGKSDRVQLRMQHDIPWQTTCDVSFAFWIENGSVFSRDFNDLPNFHDAGSGVNCGPTHGLTGSGRYYVWGFLNGSIVTLTRPHACKQGQWHYVRTTWRMDSSPNGFVKSWFDGTQIVNYSGQWASPSIAPFYQQLALYRGPMNNPAAVWIANFEFDASGAQPFALRASNPLPVPSLT